MSTQTDKIRQAIERAMARIGCPPGDNSDADLYRELQSALSELEARPSQTDEQLYKQAMDDVTPEALSRMDKRLAAIDAQTENLIPVRQAVRIVQQWIVDRALAAQAEAQEAQAIVEPVEKPNDWSNPEFRAKTFLERMLRLRADVSMWQGKCSVLRHENNRLRAKPSPEARDKAIERVEEMLCGISHVYTVYERPTHNDAIRAMHEMNSFATQALSALRGQ